MLWSERESGMTDYDTSGLCPIYPGCGKDRSHRWHNRDGRTEANRGKSEDGTPVKPSFPTFASNDPHRVGIIRLARVAVTRFHLHLVSDSTGETVHSVARACLVQFDDAAGGRACLEHGAHPQPDRPGDRRGRGQSRGRSVHDGQRHSSSIAAGGLPPVAGAGDPGSRSGDRRAGFLSPSRRAVGCRANSICSTASILRASTR